MNIADRASEQKADVHCLRIRSAIFLILLVISGCATTVPTQKSYLRTELYFGLSRHDAPDITDAQFQSFLDSIVTPRFPNGYTVIDAQGRWRDADGHIITEPSRMIILLHPDTPDDDRKINEIRDAYKRQFDQDSVLRVDDPEHVDF
jgi:hypothetical protein